MKKLFASLLLILAFLLVGCNNQSEDTEEAPKENETITENDKAPKENEGKIEDVTPVENPDDIMEDTLMSILKGELVFDDFDAGKTANLYTLGYAGINGMPGKYALVDLDNDGARELVVEYDTTGDRAVIDIKENACTSYYVPLRGMNQLKADGTMSWSNSAFEHGVRRIKFAGNGIAEEKIVLFDSVNNIFKIDDASVTREEVENAIAEQGKKQDVEWHEIPAEYKPDFVKEFCEKAEGIWTQGNDFVRFNNGKMSEGVLEGHMWVIGDVVSASKLGLEEKYEIEVYMPEGYDEMEGNIPEATYWFNVTIKDKKIQIERLYSDNVYFEEFEYYGLEY